MSIIKCQCFLVSYYLSTPDPPALWFPGWISAHFTSPFPSGFLSVLPIEPARGKSTVGNREMLLHLLLAFSLTLTQAWALYLPHTFSGCSTEFFLHSWNHEYHTWTGVSSFLWFFFHRCATLVCFGFLPLHRFLVLFLAWLFSLC